MFISFQSAASWRVFAAAVGLAASSIPATAQASAGAIRIGTPWLRETAAGQAAGGGFLTIANTAKMADRLVGGTSPIAADVQVHTMSMDGGVMRMRRLNEGLPVPAGQSVALKPGGWHIMLMGLKRPLKRGETVPVTLTFANSGKVTAQFTVQPVTYQGGGNDSRR